jgi:(p)ppGpp synthase/HD superfamily hydrolase
VTASVLERAIGLALEVHRGQIDKAGRPYILHPLRLMAAMTSEEARVVAVLHDVVEDSEATFEDLAALGLSEEALAALRLLTHHDDDGSEANYFAYVARIKANPLARVVKLADLADNLDVSRLPSLTERDSHRLNKYLKAREMLRRDDG